MKKVSKKNLGKPFKFKSKNIKKIFGDKNVLLSINWFRFDVKISKNKSNFILKTKEKDDVLDWEKEKIKIKKYKKEIKKTGELRLSFPIRRKELKTFSNLYSFKIKCIDENQLVLFKIKKKPKLKVENEEELEGSCLFGRYRDEEDNDRPMFGRSYKEEDFVENDDKPTFGKLG